MGRCGLRGVSVDRHYGRGDGGGRAGIMEVWVCINTDKVWWKLLETDKAKSDLHSWKFIEQTIEKGSLIYKLIITIWYKPKR